MIVFLSDEGVRVYAVFVFKFSFVSVRLSPDKGVHVDGSGTGHTDLVGRCSRNQHLRQIC